jgi:hypothetical protein
LSLSVPAVSRGNLTKRARRRRAAILDRARLTVNLCRSVS